MWVLRACSTLLAVIALAVPAIGQSVISTHSGVIYYFDGSVYLDNQLLEPHLGKFPSIPQGGQLRTAEGHAEVLLTPGVFLRMGEKSAIRMIANDLSNTKVELQTHPIKRLAQLTTFQFDTLPRLPSARYTSSCATRMSPASAFIS